jgi:uncharacterized protein (DUF1800 family)
MKNQITTCYLGQLFAIGFFFFALPAISLGAAAPQLDEATAVRFLRQATFGPTPKLVSEVQKLGIGKYLDQQFKLKARKYPNLKFYPESAPQGCSEQCARDNYTYYQLQRHFFSNALTGKDQLRQRVAFILSQIFVTAQSNVPLAAWMRTYQQMLYDNAFGNYRDLLEKITLSPTMGRYLDMLNNRCQTNTDPLLTPAERQAICRNGQSAQPNENYAREILQLFSIGTFMLNQDGTYQTDLSGMPIPTYDQSTVENFARVFTGWALAPALKGPGGEVPNYRDPMVVRRNSANLEIRHDRGAKTLLNGLVIPANTDAEAELEMALDNIATHSNVAPFISKHLIRHLVTSNPTPAYVQRISQVFAASYNAANQLEQVVRAILTDPEARTAPDGATDPDYGKLNEPVLFMLNFLRAFGAKSDGVLNAGSRGSAALGQDVFRSPTVFNYYPAEFEVPGEPNLVGPVFGIFTTLSAATRANFVYQLVYGSSFGADPPDRPKGTAVDLRSWEKLAANPGELVERLSCSLLHCTMSPAMKNAVLTAVNAIPATDLPGRARMAIYLTATSAQYQVQR